METLLIADHTDGFAETLKEALQDRYEVSTCADGSTALLMLDELKPDRLILNLCLPVLDGLSVLRKSSYMPPVILALTPAITPYVFQAAEDAGAGFTLGMPCTVNAVTDHLEEMAHALQNTNCRRTPQQIVAAHLDYLRIPKNRKGYRQLKVGVPLFAQDPEQSLFKELYPAIIERCGGETVEQVESTIRAVIHDTWEKHTTLWQEYFPDCEDAPSNWKFLQVLAVKLQEETLP